LALSYGARPVPIQAGNLKPTKLVQQQLQQHHHVNNKEGTSPLQLLEAGQAYSIAEGHIEEDQLLLSYLTVPAEPGKVRLQVLKIQHSGDHKTLAVDISMLL
jgi:hypothetical protein